MSEFDLIRWIRERSTVSGAAVLGIGDDCALLRPAGSGELLITTDMLMDGRHFHLAEAGAEAVGYKAMAVNLSDIAAMAGRPLAAVVAVALPRHDSSAIARSLHAGLTAAAEPFGVPIVGGDTNAWDGPLVVSVTLLGEATERGAVRRSGARRGDAIYVTGPLGGSLLGRHLRPVPRVREALAIHEFTPIRAMIDLSDGLSSDLRHILDESGGLGAILDSSAIPVHPDALRMSERDGKTPLDHALSDGEDFELCLVLDPGDAERLRGQAMSGISPIKIGQVTDRPGIWIRSEQDEIRKIDRSGFDHFRN